MTRCPYNGFKYMDCSECGAEMWIKDPKRGGGYVVQVCALAYNGASIVAPKPEPKMDGGGGA